MHPWDLASACSARQAAAPQRSPPSPPATSSDTSPVLPLAWTKARSALVTHSPSRASPSDRSALQAPSRHRVRGRRREGHRGGRTGHTSSPVQGAGASPWADHTFGAVSRAPRIDRTMRSPDDYDQRSTTKVLARFHVLAKKSEAVYARAPGRRHDTPTPAPESA
jgi:hypothetical protein